MILKDSLVIELLLNVFLLKPIKRQLLILKNV